MSGYEIDWTAVGICLTAIIAVWQLRQDSSQKAADRELETKRDILFDGVKGMSQAVQAFSGLSDLNINYSDAVKLFQAGMSQINVATSVASLPAAKAGKEFVDKIGPLFLQAMTLRAQVDDLPDGSRNPNFKAAHYALAAFILDNIIELAKAMLRAIAAVRTDVGIAKESEQEFLDAVYPNDVLVRKAVDKVLGRTAAE